MQHDSTSRGPISLGKDSRRSDRVTRREFIAALGASVVSCAAQAQADTTGDLVAGIESVTLQRGRDGSQPSWFQPRACMVPTPAGPMALMTLQAILGSDYYGPVQWMTSRDLGRMWTEPRPVAAFARVKLASGWDESVCDVVPEFHPNTNTVLAMGHTVNYRTTKFEANQPPRWPVYSVWKEGSWGERRKLEWDDPRGSHIYTNNCGQRVVLPGGEIAFAMSFGAQRNSRSVAGVRCSFDGTTLSIRQVGTEIKHSAGRGLLEPSLVRWRDRFFLTLRAEDNRGYCATSDDGLDFCAKQPWAWENGEPLEMSSTQQHWLAHSEALFLVYTRKDASNVNVTRWRAPLFMAQVDTAKLRLLRDTERIVFPLRGDGVNAADRVAYGGNFHPIAASPEESWVTDGETFPKNNYRGDLLLARIRWAKPNRVDRSRGD